MGLFGSLKNNFKHGSVKLAVQAPTTVRENDASFSATVTITNSSESPQTVKSVRVVLVEDRSQPTPGSNSVDSTRQSNVEVSSAEETNAFILQPTESKQLTLDVPLNLGKMASEMQLDNPAAQMAAKVLGGVQTLVDAMGKSDYAHYVRVVADVDGISFDPSIQTVIKILKFNEIGGGINLSL